jgi:glycosyltransferase involved in cell wall biosynthesis
MNRATIVDTDSGRDTVTIAPLACSAVLTHHWLVRRRGGEKVLEALAELLPQSPIYTLVHDPGGLRDSPLAERAIHTSLLQRLPGATRHYPKLLPLMPWALRRLRLPPADLVVCSDAALAKALPADPRSRVVCYCHSPMRYVYEPAIVKEYAATLPAVMRPLWGAITRSVRRADVSGAARVDQFVANSRHVAARIRTHYARDAIVVHPPVDLPPAPVAGPREDFYLCVGYHTRYKRLDLAVAACRQLGRRLVVIGTGPETRRINPRRDSHVTLLGWQPTDVINDHYRRAAGLLFPGEEDFGIVPVEAIAHGCPVIAYGVGGATETVTPGVTGALFETQSRASLIDALYAAERVRFDPRTMHEWAQRFSRPRFLREMRGVLCDVLERGPREVAP